MLSRHAGQDSYDDRVEIGVAVRTLGVSCHQSAAGLVQRIFLAAPTEGNPMSLTDRVFGAFEAELVKHLAFSFSLVRRTDVARSSKTIMKVWIRNNSSIDLIDVRGSISHGPAADFRTSPFYLAKLGPGDEFEVAEIDVNLLEPAHDRTAYDRMATVNVSATPDLTRFRVRGSAMDLTHVATGIPLSNAPERVTPRRPERFNRPLPGPPSLEVNWEAGSRKKPA